MNSWLILLIAAVLLVAFVALPCIIALARQHPERKLILRLTPLAAISFALWLVLLVWASSDKRDDAVISRYVARLRQNNRLPLMLGGVVAIGAIVTLATFVTA